MIMNKEDIIRNILWSIAIHESGHIVALLSYHIKPYYVELNESGGCTHCHYPEDWTKEDDDYVLLAGTVAEHMGKGMFDDLVRQVVSGDVPEGASSDFSKLQMTDAKEIADAMLRIHDYFCNRRWSFVLEFASELLKHGTLVEKDIAAIADRLCGIDGAIGRIARQEHAPFTEFLLVSKAVHENVRRKNIKIADQTGQLSWSDNLSSKFQKIKKPCGRRLVLVLRP